MNNRPHLLGTLVIALMSLSTCLNAQSSPVELPSKKNFHLFILAGQSNMAGRGHIEEQDKVAHPRILALSADREWIPAVAPIHFDKKQAGVGLAKSFALEMVEADPEITIGLIPAACGGSPIESWQPGGYHIQTHSPPYDDAISRTRTALKDGVLKGILWHQGESDSRKDRARHYEKRLRALVKRFRGEFNNPELPMVIGQLGQFPEKPWDEHRKRVDRAQQAVVQYFPQMDFVSSNGLTPMEDNTHFDSKSLRIFGQRYADAFLDASVVTKKFKSTARRTSGRSAKGRKIED
ncbi:sialate O-acetylesterase [Opitutia bacterium ISCC 51]|nr:sialate O-acetylesterase [Opitutae bacterium ISCC 51]QXD30333.1 sialate O-acetylesterase [Opitutae bacterium ISCC 52]